MARKSALIPIGSVFGRLTVIGHTRLRGRQACECLCECGASHVVAASDLKASKTRSCGCYNSERRREVPKTHGDSRKRLFHIWAQMLERCKPGLAQSKNYGDRGIRVCHEWAANYETFRTWALESGYRDDLTIERVDVNGDYCPANCTWITRTSQVYNRRVSLRLTIGGVTKCLSEWCREQNVNYRTARSRLLKGWSIEHLFDPPVPHKLSERPLAARKDGNFQQQQSTKGTAR